MLLLDDVKKKLREVRDWQYRGGERPSNETLKAVMLALINQWFEDSMNGNDALSGDCMDTLRLIAESLRDE